MARTFLMLAAAGLTLWGFHLCVTSGFVRPSPRPEAIPAESAREFFERLYATAGRG